MIFNLKGDDSRACHTGTLLSTFRTVTIGGCHVEHLRARSAPHCARLDACPREDRASGDPQATHHDLPLTQADVLYAFVMLTREPSSVHALPVIRSIRANLTYPSSPSSMNRCGGFHKLSSSGLQAVNVLNLRRRSRKPGGSPTRHARRLTAPSFSVHAHAVGAVEEQLSGEAKGTMQIVRVDFRECALQRS